MVYHVPPLMMQPLTMPPVITGSCPLPEKGIPGTDGADGVGLGGAEVVVERVVLGGALPKTLGKYLIPVAGQSDLEPSKKSKPRTDISVRKNSLTWVGRRILPGLNTASHIVEIPDLLKSGLPAALDGYLDASRLRKCCVDLRSRVRPSGRRFNASGFEEFVRVQRLEKIDGLLEIGDYFLLRCIVHIATWF